MKTISYVLLFLVVLYAIGCLYLGIKCDRLEDENFKLKMDLFNANINILHQSTEIAVLHSKHIESKWIADSLKMELAWEKELNWNNKVVHDTIYFPVKYPRFTYPNALMYKFDSTGRQMFYYPKVYNLNQIRNDTLIEGPTHLIEN
jgi:hypothetical protein